jgi:hypothetical protein
VLIGTERFTYVIEAMARIAGIAGIRWATVPHPLGSAPREVLRERASQALEQFERIVVADPEH